MREARSYRTRPTKTEAVRELRAGAGTQFDPVCVDVLPSVVVPR